MVNKFCPSCGRTLKESGLCSDCDKKEIPTDFEVPLIQVSEFNRTFFKGAWHRFNNIEELIIRRVHETIGEEVEVEIPSFEFTPQPKEKITFEILAHIQNKIIPIPIKLSYMQCDFGQKQKTAYYEGILQLREPHQEVFNFLDRQLAELAPKGVFITKTAEQKNGIDLYFTNKTQMQLLAQKIGTKFGAQVSMHPQLFSRNHQTSKDIYRLNVLVTLPPFGTGSVISFDYPRKGRATVLIKSMGKITHGFDLKQNKQTGFELKNCQDIVVHPIYETTISSTHPTLGVLDPETFQEEQVQNTPKLKHALGENVRVAKTPYGLYLIE